MTIFTSTAELLDVGPQTLTDLTAHAVRTGATRARNPEASVRAAIAYRAVELPDGRWASPAQLLEGRVLTTRGRHPRSDLAPLHCADRWLRRESVPHWFEEGSLHAVTLRDGDLQVERVEVLPNRELPALLGPLTPRRWHSGAQALTDDLVHRLWGHLDGDPSLLTVPGLPLSESFPELQQALTKEAAEREAYAALWHPTLALPAWLEGLADCLASEAGLSVHDYLVEIVTESLAEDRQPAKLIALPHRG